MRADYCMNSATCPRPTAFLPPILAWLVVVFPILVISARPVTFLPALCALFGLLFMLRCTHYRPRVIETVRSRPFVVLIGMLALLLGLEGMALSWRIATAGDPVFAMLKQIPIFFGGIVLLIFMQRVCLRASGNLGWIALLGGLFGLALLIEQLLGFPLYRYVKNLPAGEEVNISEMNKRLALFILLLPAFYVFARMPEKPAYRWALLALLAVSTIGLLCITASQAAQLAVPIMLIVWIIARCRPLLALRLVCLGAAVYIVTAPFVFPLLYAHLNGVVSPKAGGVFHAASIMPRLELWAFISDAIQNRPFTGYGIDAASALSRLDWNWTYFKNYKIYHPHNGVLQFWLELGMGGALWLLAALVAFYRLLAGKSMQVVRVGATAAAGTATFSIITWSIWQSWWLGGLFFIAGMTLLAARTYSAQHEAPVIPVTDQSV